MGVPISDESNSVVTTARFGKVLSLDEARQVKQNRLKRKEELEVVPLNRSDRYFCSSCESDHFRLYRDKTVHCAVCNRFIQNLGVDC